MATLAIIAENKQEAIEAARDIAEDGYPHSFGVRGAGERARDPAIDYVETLVADVFPLEWNEKFSKDIQIDDRLFMAEPNRDIEKCTHMKDEDGNEMKIIEARPFRPDNVTVIFYEVLVR